MLFMVEVALPDPAAAARWFADALGFAVELTDGATGFVLLAHPAGGSKLALKPGPGPPAGVTLHLRVAGLDGEVARLARRGDAIDGDVVASGEGYRRAKLRGPGGVAVVLFEWCAPPA